MTTTNTLEPNVNTRKYVIQFGIAYAIAMVAVLIIVEMFEINTNSGLSIATLMGAGVYASSKFVHDQKRAPNKKEKTQITWGSLITCWLISIIAVILVVAFSNDIELLPIAKDLINSIGIPIFIGILFVVSLIYYGVLAWSYGGMAQRQVATLEKQKQKQSTSIK